MWQRKTYIKRMDPTRFHVRLLRSVRASWILPTILAIIVVALGPSIPRVSGGPIAPDKLLIAVFVTWIFWFGIAFYTSWKGSGDIKYFCVGCHSILHKKWDRCPECGGFVEPLEWWEEIDEEE